MTAEWHKGIEPGIGTECRHRLYQ